MPLYALSDVGGRGGEETLTLRTCYFVEAENDVFVVQGFADEVAAGGGNVGVGFSVDLYHIISIQFTSNH